MSQPVLFTVGHSNHEFDALAALLKLHDIAVVADVRSSPYSRHNSQFNREVLCRALGEQGIEYVFVGDELGAWRPEPECYADGKVQFDRVARLPIFQQGLQRLCEIAAAKRVTLLCAEKDPLTCHRTILICRHLRKHGVDIQHILEDGRIETQAQAEDRLLALMKLPPGDLFTSKDSFVEEAYDRQAEKIGFVDSAAELADSIGS